MGPTEEDGSSDNVGVEAIVRACLAGLVLGVAFAAYRAIQISGVGVSWSAGYAVAVTEYLTDGASLGFLALLPAVVEGIAAGGPRTWRRLVVAALLAWPAALAGTVLAQAVSWFFANLVFHCSTKEGLEAFKRALVAAVSLEKGTLRFWAPAVSVGALLVPLRLARTRPASQVALLAPLAWALAVKINPRYESSCRWFAFEHLSLVVVLPLAAALGAPLARRLVAAITKAPPPPPRPSVAGVRGRRTRLALVAGAEVVAFFVAAHVIYRDVPPAPALKATWARARRLRAEWETFLAGKLPEGELEGLVARSISVKHAVRPQLGVEDPLCVERNVSSIVGRAMKVYVDSDVTIDDVPMPRTWDYHGLRYWTQLGRRRGEPHWVPERIWVERGRRDVGEHHVRIETRLSVTDGLCEIWSGTTITDHKVQVQKESVRGSIWRVALSERDRERLEVDISRGDGAWLGLHVGASDCPAPVSLAFTVLDERGAKISSQSYFTARGGGMGTSLPLHGLAPGRHVVRVLVSPDPDQALEESATVDAIADYSRLETFSVEVE